MKKYLFLAIAFLLMLSTTILQPATSFADDSSANAEEATEENVVVEVPTSEVLTTQIAATNYTLSDFQHTITFTRPNGSTVNQGSASSPNTASQTDRFVIGYNVKLPDSGVRVKGGDTLTFTYDVTGITIPTVTNKPLSTSSGAVGAYLTTNSAAKTATVTFTSAVETLSNIEVNVALDVNIYDTSQTTTAPKTVTVNKVPYYFEYKAPGTNTNVFGKRGDALSRNLIMWSAVAGYASVTTPNFTNLIIEDEFEANLTLIKIPSDRLTSRSVLVTDYIQYSCGGCTINPADVEFTPKVDSAGKITGFTLKFLKPVPTTPQLWIYYYTNALDNGDQKKYNNNITFTSDEYATAKYSSSNEEFSGGITGSFAGVKILKVDENKLPMNGARFKLEKFDDVENVWKVVDEKDVEYGQAYFSGLIIGDYRITETKYPDKYGKGYYEVGGTKVESEVYTFKIQTADLSTTGKAIEITAVNEPLYGTLSILKTDAATGNPLAGATFVLKDASGTVIKTLVTNAQGIAEDREIPKGTYTLEETIAPDNYVISYTSETIEILGGKTVSKEVKNEQKKFILALTKVDAVSNKGLANVPFTLFKLEGSEWVAVAGYENVVTDTEGKYTFTNLVAGTYKAIEQTSPTGYLAELDASDEVIFATSDNPTTVKSVTVTNVPYVNVVVTKEDADTQSKLSGATFKLYKQNNLGTYVLVSEDEYVTNADGKVQIDKLTLGNYRLIETKAPDRYLLLSAPVSFTITEQHLAMPGTTIMLPTIKNSLDPNDPRNDVEDDDIDNPNNGGNNGVNNGNLPQTFATSANYSMVGTLLLLAGLGLLFVTNRRRLQK